MKYINAHCHHDTNRPAECVGIILNAAREADWGTVVQHVAENPDAHGAIGIHPWQIESVTPGWDMRLGKILQATPRLMLGETGLDSHRPDIAHQTALFVRHLEIAKQFDRAVQIHCVGAWDLLLSVLADFRGPVIMHAFSGSTEVMQRIAAKYNVWFSFGPGILDGRHVRMRRAVAAADAGRILVESDDMPHDVIPDIIRVIADIRGIEMHTAADIIYNNTIQVLNYGQTAQN